MAIAAQMGTRRLGPWLALAVLLFAFVSISASVIRRTSTTVDEIIFTAGGARGDEDETFLSRLNVGVRYALPSLVAAIVTCHVVLPLTYPPCFLCSISGSGPGRDRNDALDSHFPLTPVTSQPHPPPQRTVISAAHLPGVHVDRDPPRATARRIVGYSVYLYPDRESEPHR